MIKLAINKDVFISQILEKVSAIEELLSPTVLQEVAKGAFTILGERFVVAVDREAVRNPKKLHHIYEWGKIGNPSGRLFVIERAGILGGTLIINTSFLPSRLPVPVPKELKTPGPTGKFVSSKNIFKYKAEVMEKGFPISFDTKKIITFLGSEGQVFVPPGKTITIMNPGGIQTKNAFRDFMVMWYTEHSNTIMDASGFYEKIAHDTALVVSSAGGNKTAVKSVVAQIVNSIPGNKEVIV
jgi:hypothetical protein